MICGVYRNAILNCDVIENCRRCIGAAVVLHSAGRKYLRYNSFAFVFVSLLSSLAFSFLLLLNNRMRWPVVPFHCYVATQRHASMWMQRRKYVTYKGVGRGGIATVMSVWPCPARCCVYINPQSRYNQAGVDLFGGQSAHDT